MKTYDEFLSGRLCSFGDDEPSMVSTTQRSEPWQAEYLNPGFSQAHSQVLNRPLEYFPDSTVVPFSGQTEQALRSMEQRATSPNPIVGTTQDLMTRTLGGEFLQGGNPAYGAMVSRATDPMVRNFQENIVPSINASFSAGGRTNSGIARQNALGQQADILSRNVGDISANLAFQNYANERGMMQNAMAMAPQIDAFQYSPMEKLLGVGQQREDLSTRQLQDQINRFNFEQTEPMNRIGSYLNMIGGNYGGTVTGTQPVQQSNPWLTGLGAASLGAGTLGTLFGGQGVWPGALSFGG